METEVTCRTLIDLFCQALGSAELAGKNCLEIVRTERRENLTFGELLTKAPEFAAHLIASKAIHTGDKIAILGKNRVDWDIAFWGSVLAGAVPVLIDPERRIEGVSKHILHTNAKLLIMADDYQDSGSREKLRQFLGDHGITTITMTAFEKPRLNSSEIATLIETNRQEIKADDTAVILCTSGTTADPREVEIMHSNLIANIRGTLDVVKITAADKLGHILPPHHSFGLTVGKLIPLWAGATNLYTNKYRQVPQLIKEKGATIFIGIPALFTALARNIEAALAKQKEKNYLLRLADRYFPKLVGRKIVKKLGWRRLRFLLSGAAPVPKWVLEVFWKRGLQLREGYGTTENSPVYGFNSNIKKTGSVGRPISTLQVKIVNEQGQTLKPGQRGEILLGGPCIMKGYYENRRATDAVIKANENGTRRLHTGDLGHLDEDGYLYITGRKKNIIVLPGGKNVHPELVEMALCQAEFVEELIVVPGFKRDTGGIKKETIRAIIRPAWDQIRARANLSQRDLTSQPEILKDLVWQSISKSQRGNQQLAAFEKIQSKDFIEIKIDEFVKTSNKKVKRSVYMQAVH